MTALEDVMEVPSGQGAAHRNDPIAIARAPQGFAAASAARPDNLLGALQLPVPPGAPQGDLLETRPAGERRRPFHAGSRASGSREPSTVRMPVVKCLGRSLPRTVT